MKYVSGLLRIVSFLLFIAGIVLLVWDAPSEPRAARLPVRAAAEVANAAPEQEVLLEGVIDASNQPRLGGLVAYTYGWNNRWGNWQALSQVLPPLRIAVADGVVETTEGGARLVMLAPPVVVAAPPPADEPASSSRRARFAYRGFVVGDPIVVIGTTQLEGTQTAVRVDLLYGGTREELIASTQRRTFFNQRLGPIIIATGLVVFLVVFAFSLAVGTGNALFGTSRTLRRWLRRK